MHYLVASSLHQNTKKSATNPVEHQTSDGSTTVPEAFVVEIFKIRSLLRETRKPWKHQHLTLKLAQRETKNRGKDRKSYRLLQNELFCAKFHQLLKIGFISYLSFENWSGRPV